MYVCTYIERGKGKEGPFLLVIIVPPACLLQKGKGQAYITLTIPKENPIFSSLIQHAISAFSFLCLIIYILTVCELIFRGVLILLIFDNIYHTYTHVTHLQKTRLFPKKRGEEGWGKKPTDFCVEARIR